MAASSASTNSPTREARPAARADSIAAVSSPTLRGLRAKNTSPICVARAAIAASSASGVVMPQIFTRVLNRVNPLCLVGKRG